MKMLFIALALILSVTNGNENIRYDNGTVMSNYLYEEDYNIVVFVDSNGDEWIIEDSVAPVGSKCIIEYNTKGTEYLYDDEILSVIYLDVLDQGK